MFNRGSESADKAKAKGREPGKVDMSTEETKNPEVTETPPVPENPVTEQTPPDAIPQGAGVEPVSEGPAPTCIQSAPELPAMLAMSLKFIADLVNDPFALTPMAKVRAQEFLARI